MRQQVGQQAAIRKVDRDPMNPAVERSRRPGRVAPEQGQVGWPPAWIAPHLIEAGVDTDHAQIRSLPGEPQRIGRVTGAEIDVQHRKARAPGHQFRRVWRREVARKEIHLVAFPVRSDMPNAEKAARRTSWRIMRSETVKNGWGVLEASRQARQGNHCRVCGRSAWSRMMEIGLAGRANVAHEALTLAMSAAWCPRRRSVEPILRSQCGRHKRT